MYTLLGCLQSLSFDCLVDMGCGAGEFIVELARLKPQAHLIGIDIDETAIGEAHGRVYAGHLASRVDFACGDCVDVPLAARSADVIVFRGLLHHVEEVALALAEAYRVLDEGGCLLIQDGRQMPAPLFGEMNEALRQSGRPGEIHRGFDLKDLSEELAAHGLIVQEVMQAGTAILATPPYTQRVYSTGLFLLSAGKARRA